MAAHEAAIRRIPPPYEVSPCSAPLLLFALVAAPSRSPGHGLGRPVPMPPSPLGRRREANLHLLCAVPWRPGALHLGPPHSRRADRRDLKRLSPLTSCVRTYSATGAQGRVTRLAGQARLEGPAGDLARAQPGRQSARDRGGAPARPPASRHRSRPSSSATRCCSAASSAPPRSRPISKRCGRRSGLPVTYADVWEFWLKAPELAAAVDFVTIHILPYWEDEPVAAEDAVDHVREVRDEARRQPSPARRSGSGRWAGRAQGRMRDGALPSPANQARC